MARQDRVPLWQGKARIRRSQRVGSVKHGKSLDSHRDGIALMRLAPRRHGQGTHRKGVAQSRKAAALLWTAWPGTATAKVRGAMRCQGIARLSWRRRAPQRMSIAWLGWGRASCGSAVAEHQNAQRRPAMAKFSEASQRLSTTAHREGLAQQRLARRLQGLARNSTA